MTPLLLFNPLYQQRVWGGHVLESWLGRRNVVAGPVGESWEMVDRPEAQSVVASGPWAGRSLRDLLTAHAAEVMGPGWPPGRRFPILVKWLDCRERLSLQVHPPTAVAADLGGEPKTENWFIARADDGAAVFAGLKAGVTPDDFARALEAGTAEGCMRRLPVRAGDSLLIRSGVMHAIDAGNVILEIQQNSDTTYRVYDWGRVGLDGQPRTLHVSESLSCLRASATLPEPQLAEDGASLLADCAEFRIRRLEIPPGGRLDFAGGEEPRILSVAKGSVRVEGGEPGSLRLGDNALLPHAGAFGFASDQGATILVTDRFARA